MANKKIHIIINPAAGRDEPILSYLNQIFCDTDIDWDVTVSHKNGDVYNAAREQIDKADIIAVYGGDGSVMEAARALHKSDMLFAIIPGGTANVMAKEMDIPLDSLEAIRLIASPDYLVKEIDMGIVNGCPFLIRVNLGILSDMITETTTEMKDKWGQWAYGITAFQTFQQEAKIFDLTIDGKTYTQESVGLTITNAGNIGKKGYSFLPGISVSDGMLDVISFDKADFMSLLKISGSMLFQKDSGVLKHWVAKEVIIKMPAQENFLCDDGIQAGSSLHIKVSPRSLKMLVPKIKEDV